MKRVIALVLVFMMAAMLFGCGKEELPTEGVVGDTLKSDMVEVTLTKFGFAEEGVTIDKESDDKIFCTPIPFPYQITGNEMMDSLTMQLSQSVYVRKTEEKCIPYLEYTIKIVGEDMPKQTIMPCIKFGDATYSFNAISGEALADYFNGQYDGVSYVKMGDNWNTMNFFWSTGEYLGRAVAKISAEVEQSGDPLTVVFSVPQSDGTNVSLTYTIR